MKLLEFIQRIQSYNEFMDLNTNVFIFDSKDKQYLRVDRVSIYDNPYNKGNATLFIWGSQREDSFGNYVEGTK